MALGPLLGFTLIGLLLLIAGIGILVVTLLNSEARSEGRPWEWVGAISSQGETATHSP